jgi:signal transduction histidine kinase
MTSPFIRPGSTLGDLPSHQAQFSEDALGSRIVAALQQNVDLPGIIVRRHNGAIAIVSRQSLFQEMSIQYSREVYLGRPIAIFLRSRGSEPLKLPASTPINDAASTALRRPQPTAYEPLLVEWESNRVGLLDMHVLLQAQSQLLAATHVAMLQNEKLASVGQLAAGVAHEINNPLAFVINNNAVLRRDVQALRKLIDLYRRGDDALAAQRPELKREIDDLVERIDLPYTTENLDHLLLRSTEGLRRIQEIVQNLRDFVRLDQSDFHSIDLNEGIESTVNIIRHRAQARRVEITLHLSPLPQVACYPARMNQVFLNLLSNAIDASPEGAAVAVRSSREESIACIEVVDAGCGIEPAVRGRIFEPFFTTKPVGSGTGLGLSVSYGIVKDHGGEIDFESEVGRGSTFRVRLRLNMPVARREIAPQPA